MLLSTDLIRTEEREAALAVVPWRDEIRELTRNVLNTMIRKTIDLIDVAIGPGNHGRAAIVATFEGLTHCSQATIDVGESVARQAFFTRVDPLDPLAIEGTGLPPEGRERYRRRQARLSIEDAAIRAAAGGDHLANAYLRLAWETTVATEAEVKACGFDPSEPEPRSWASVPECQVGLKRLGGQPLALLPGFSLTPAFERYAADAQVQSTRELRHEIVHRARPGYRESAPFGRTSLWERSGHVHIKLDNSPWTVDEDPDLPSFDDRREQVGAAVREGLTFANAIWDLTRLWLASIDISVKHRGLETEVTTTLHHDDPGPRYPRAERNPQPFLIAPH